MQRLNIKKSISNLKDPGETLSQRAVRSGFWVFSLRIIQQLFNLSRLIILARILAPHDFGVLGIALLTMATLETFSQTGFQVALIQKKEDIKSHLDAAWTVLILRGFILFAILYLIAPYAAFFFNAPEAKPIIQVIGFSVLLQAFTNIGVIYFQKELEFNKEFIYQFAGTLADFIVAFSAVLILRNVWALVFGLLAGNFIRFVVSYLIHPYRPNLSSDLGKAKELFGFGKWILGSSILIFLITQGDDIFVGKLLGVAALGFYQLAYRISNMPAIEIAHMISSVTFPAYSKLQDDLPKLREAYLRTLEFTAFLSVPIAGLIFILASDFTMIFLGDKWMPMVTAMQILCIFGMTRAINSAIAPYFAAIGQPRINTKVSAAQLILMSIIIYPLTKSMGISGTAIAVTLPNVFALIYLAVLISYKINIPISNHLKNIGVPVIISTIIIVLLTIVQASVRQIDISMFFGLAIGGVISYFGLVFLLGRFLHLDFVVTLKYILKTLINHSGGKIK